MSKSSSADTLIASLAEELEPVKVLAHPLKRAALWIVIAVVYVVSIAFVTGIRPDLSVALSNPVFLFEVIIMSAVFVTGACATSWLCVPDMRGQSWLIAVPLTFFGCFLLWTGVQMLAHDTVLPHIHIHSCIYDAILIGFIPAATIVFLTSRGATTRPVLASFMGMMSVGAWGYVALRFTCMNDMLGHVGLYHFLPYLVFGVIIGAIAQRFYRW